MTNKSFRFSELLSNKRFAIALSILLAILLWFAATIASDENQTIIIENVPITLDAASDSALRLLNLDIIDGAEQTVSVRVQGVRYKISTLTEKDFVAIPKLNGVTSSGMQEIPIEVKKVNSLDSDYQIVSYTSSVTMQIDRLLNKTLTLSAIADGVTAAEGFTKETPIPTPNEITLTGPQAQIDRVYSCAVIYEETEELDDTKVVQGRLACLDVGGKELPADQIKNITFDQRVFEMTIPIYQHKEVPVELTFVNVPEGLDPTQLPYQLSADSLIVAGPKDIVAKRESVSIGPIDFGKLTLGKSFDFPVSLEAAEINVNAIDSIKVTILSDALDKTELNITNIISRNKPSGYNVTIKGNVINSVALIGKKEDIAKLTSKDLVAVVDLSKVTADSWRLPVSIYSTGNKFVWAVGEYYVTVSVTKSTS